MKTQLRLLVILMSFSPMILLAQQASPAQSSGPAVPADDCFKEWTSLFRERGAAAVTDGTHSVVISLWNSKAGTSNCYMGKVDVSGGKIKRPVLVQKEDGSFEPFSTLGKGLDPSMYKNMTEDQIATITDGMSIYFQLSDIEGGQIFFYTFVNPKPKKLKEAPSAKSLVKN